MDLYRREDAVIQLVANISQGQHKVTYSHKFSLPQCVALCYHIGLASFNQCLATFNQKTKKEEKTTLKFMKNNVK